MHIRISENTNFVFLICDTNLAYTYSFILSFSFHKICQFISLISKLGKRKLYIRFAITFQVRCALGRHTNKKKRRHNSLIFVYKLAIIIKCTFKYVHTNKSTWPNIPSYIISKNNWKVIINLLQPRKLNTKDQNCWHIFCSFVGIWVFGGGWHF